MKDVRPPLQSQRLIKAFHRNVSRSDLAKVNWRNRVCRVIYLLDVVRLFRTGFVERHSELLSKLEVEEKKSVLENGQTVRCSLGSSRGTWTYPLASGLVDLSLIFVAFVCNEHQATVVVGVLKTLILNFAGDSLDYVAAGGGGWSLRMCVVVRLLEVWRCLPLSDNPSISADLRRFSRCICRRPEKYPEVNRYLQDTLTPQRSLCWACRQDYAEGKESGTCFLPERVDSTALSTFRIFLDLQCP